MFNTQLNYWNDMSNMVMDAYKNSLSSGQQFQEGFAAMLKEMMETNIKNTLDVQKEMEGHTKKNVDAYMDNLVKVSRFYSDNREKGLETMKGLFEKYSITNSQFRDEMEKLWKENFDEFQKKMQEFSDTFKSNQEKSIDFMFEVFKKSSKNMEEFSKKLGEMNKAK
ncbi:MAG: hypothetical protein ABRQ37_05365 [Candidatus Eremiobacterota bacterium]